jgi:hypothetical protein
MEHEYVARFLQETPSDDRGILYSKMRPDGRVEFFAAINKTVFELDEEKHTSSCLIYEIGYRPDQKEYWQEFEADNGVGALRSKNVVSKEEVPEKSKKDQIVAGMKVKLASLGKYSPFKKEN